MFWWNKPKLPFNKQQLQDTLSAELAKQGYDAHRTAKRMHILWQFQEGIVDSFVEEDAVAAVQRWAMAAAKEKGASDARGAYSIVRGGDVTTAEWNEVKAVWEMLWPRL